MARFGAPLLAMAAASVLWGAGEVRVPVKLLPRVANPATELISFGLPLPPGPVSDARRIRVLDAHGKEIAAAVRALEPWRQDGREGAIRSVVIQFETDFRSSPPAQITVAIGRPRSKSRSAFIPVGEELPRVLAVLPAKWLCESQVAGPQAPASSSRVGQTPSSAPDPRDAYSAYDEFVERNFPGSLRYIDSTLYSDWLFDRTTCWYKMYVRTGDPKYFEAAFRAANFVRRHTEMNRPTAGIFTLKGVDLKYVYPRAMHLHYLLTGDERALETGKVMARFCLNNWDPVYRADTKFWTPRHTGYGLLGVLHGWEMTGDRAYWNKAQSYIDALYAHQQQPPDGLPPDGSWRQNWARYAPEEARFEGATSPWMTAILLDPLFHYWTLTHDPRVPEMVLKWCDFLDRKGLQPDGAKAYYVVNCLAKNGEPGGRPGGDMFLHNTEISYMFAMGMFFSKDAQRTAAYRKRFAVLFPLALQQDMNRVARSYNWAFQASPQMIYFLLHSNP